MDYTSSIFVHEGNLKDPASKSELAKKLNLGDVNEKEPILFQMIRALTSGNIKPQRYWPVRFLLTNLCSSTHETKAEQPKPTLNEKPQTNEKNLLQPVADNKGLDAKKNEEHKGGSLAYLLRFLITFPSY